MEIQSDFNIVYLYMFIHARPNGNQFYNFHCSSFARIEATFLPRAEGRTAQNAIGSRFAAEAVSILLINFIEFGFRLVYVHLHDTRTITAGHICTFFVRLNVNSIAQSQLLDFRLCSFC